MLRTDTAPTKKGCVVSTITDVPRIALQLGEKYFVGRPIDMMSRMPAQPNSNKQNSDQPHQLKYVDSDRQLVPAVKFGGSVGIAS